MNPVKALAVCFGLLAFLFAVYSAVGYAIIATLLAVIALLAVWVTAPKRSKSRWR